MVIYSELSFSAASFFDFRTKLDSGDLHPGEFAAVADRAVITFSGGDT
jgi:hypothetical protein